MTVAIAATTVPLTPSGKWVVDYQPHNCIASRTFGVSPADVGLALTPMFSLTADKRTFLVLAPAKGGRGPIVGNAKMTFLPSRRETQVSLFSWVSGTRRLYELGVTDDASLSEAARSTGITIATGQQVFSFATGNLAPVLDALTECTGKLLVSWGVDPSTLVKDRPERQQWFPPEEYPKAALRQGIQGNPVIVLTIASSGKASACKVVVPAGDSLDQKTCELALRNVKLPPDPNATIRTAIMRVRWSLHSD